MKISISGGRLRIRPYRDWDEYRRFLEVEGQHVCVFRGLHPLVLAMEAGAFQCSGILCYAISRAQWQMRRKACAWE